MNPYLEIVMAFVYYSFYAFLTALRWVTYPLRPIWYLIYVFILPFFYIGQFFASSVAYPLHKLPGSAIETLYIYLATAAILGVVTGLTLYLTRILLTTTLNLSPSTPPKPDLQSKPAKRTLTQYRASRLAKAKSLKNLPLTDLNLDEFSNSSVLSPRSLTSPNLSPSLMHSPTTTNGKGRGDQRWARKGLSLSSHHQTTIMEEGDSDEYF
ncbi:Phospholipid-transporting ATPase [Venturia nashicola]|uniref:Phospholipid-transporting ATPase n=1 Tax=Venturia nashicola TaxID=86259 RepID=A0A4Z1NU73_9PEZI|nr:Phospholipid-transporting ATPase [Venturia nashicola]TLD29970.1 Phospholipid-transporting ATPase [Venturia nashicola]